MKIEGKKVEGDEPNDRALCWILWFSTSRTGLLLLVRIFRIQCSFRDLFLNFGELVFLWKGSLGKFENEPSLWIIFTIELSLQSIGWFSCMAAWWSSWWLCTDTYWQGKLFLPDNLDDMEVVGYSTMESISDLSPQPDPNETLCPEKDDDFLLQSKWTNE